MDETLDIFKSIGAISSQDKHGWDRHPFPLSYGPLRQWGPVPLEKVETFLAPECAPSIEMISLRLKVHPRYVWQYRNNLIVLLRVATFDLSASEHSFCSLFRTVLYASCTKVFSYMNKRHHRIRQSSV